MKQKNARPPVLEKLRGQIPTLWPALKGSLALVRKPCIRAGCRHCASGHKHPAHVLAFTDRGRRRCMHVPASLVPLLKRALKNGRRLEALLYQAGPALIREHRRKQVAKTTLKILASSTKSTTSVKIGKTKN